MAGEKFVFQYGLKRHSVDSWGPAKRSVPDPIGDGEVRSVGESHLVCGHQAKQFVVRRCLRNHGHLIYPTFCLLTTVGFMTLLGDACTSDQ